MNIIVTCEHGGNQVPIEYQNLFIGHEVTLNSHRGWDPGALHLAKQLASRYKLPLFESETTRLLIELNRSLHHPQLFSEFSQHLSKEEKDRLIQQFYNPYRNTVEEFIRQSGKPLCHLSVHSFTPVLHDEVRSTDVGLLFDPSRTKESMICTQLKKEFNHVLPDNQIDFNKPYLGTDDGFTTYLRTKFTDLDYAGIEIELNQKLASDQTVMNKVVDAIASITY